MPCAGGLLIAALLLIFPAADLGLILPLIDRAIYGDHVDFFAFLWKILFVVVTLGSGFYGGTFTLQLVIGSVAENVFALAFGLNPVLGAQRECWRSLLLHLIHRFPL
ncbi:chloride channel protein [Weizmannia acidilactici]|uniref:chloride channel protein n=1 Tax=Weizmannia acidilactici TaxID=2607726 RepID=UPI0020A314E7|nr:chloride channel protein [Weizmannia acidilactici]